MGAHHPINAKRLAMVHADLVRAVNEAVLIVPFTLMVQCGLRTVDEQRVLVATGKSRTMKSYHLPQPFTGRSHAVDLAKWDDAAREFDYDDEAVFAIADAMRVASKIIEKPITWGGIWERPLHKIAGGLVAAYADYKRRFRAANNRSPFFDGVHFQLSGDW